MTAPTPVRREPRRVRLHVLAAASVAILLIVIVGALGWQTYRGVQEILRSTAYDETRYIRDALGEKVQRILEPAESQLSMLAYSDLSQADTLARRLAELPPILDAMKRNKLVDAAYVGYPNGEFILFRPLRNAAARTAFDAPPAAAMVVQSITRDAADVMLGTYQFYDADAHLIDSAFRPGYRFDPRMRPWYKAASANGDGAILTDPYPFFTTKAVGATMARRSVDGAVVVGLDVTLQSIASALDDLRITASTEIAVIDREQHVIGYRDAAKMVAPAPHGGLRLNRIDELGIPVLARAATVFGRGEGRGALTIDGRGWQVLRASIPGQAAQTFTVLIGIPNDELFAAARQIVSRQAAIGFVILLIAIVIGWAGARMITRSLHLLVRETNAIRSFDFSRDSRIPTMIAEVDNLARAMDAMKETIRKFLAIGNALSAERDLGKLLERVVGETARLASCDGGVLYLIDHDGRRLEPEIARWHGQRIIEEHIVLPSLSMEDMAMLPEAIGALKDGEVSLIERPLQDGELEALGLLQAMRALEHPSIALIAVPLLNRRQEPLGLLLLIKAVRAGEGWQASQRLREVIRAVSGSAGVAIENSQLLQGQKDLMNALIKLIAGAIDAKSAYTGGHCQRVPVLTRLLAEAACAQQDGPFKDFQLSEEEWEAVEIGSWLHDCGKVTTPEYVVDKATKLETIYDRIHEVRMRFEVLKRDVEIAYWQAVAKGGDADPLRERMAAELGALDEDFAFVAECNEGGEFMDPARLERLKRIAARTWRRTLDDRLGVSYEEKARKARTPAPVLPVEEPLLADREDHITYREARDMVEEGNSWGIRVETPPHKLNRGELYNLSIGRGTLTTEERYIINDHMTQTIMMLESLPLPRHLRDVPEIAGGHHEKMNGTGYPKRLKRDQMSPVARMMAIADVFEALTAADRPYKKAKPLSEAIRIMGFMKKDHHLDPDLLDLFLSAGVWKAYAERFLDKAQIDEPDIAAVLRMQPA
jgi:HD-GYP domain-containing protein (c-di-GMP phosphodiesterase class II)